MVAKSMFPLSGARELDSCEFNPARLTFARTRRGLKKAQVAKLIGVTPRSVTGYEAGEFPPEPDRVIRLAECLDFPPEFFFEEDAIDIIDAEIVSFRAMTKMGATLKNVALGAGSIAVQLNGWIESRFGLPGPDLPDFGRDMGPEAAAEALRSYWGLGEQSVKNMVHLLEVKGVRLFSLAIDAKEVDAFSMWWDGTPFVFLNTYKSAEHSRFDAAHELGHLIMHRHGQPHGIEAEKEANAFASAFLMPAKSVLATKLRFPSVNDLIKFKRHWSVSVAALNYRLHALGLTTEWTNRSLCIQISKCGYRTSEPSSIPLETSQVLEKVFAALRDEGITKVDVARELRVTTGEIDELTYGLLRMGAVPHRLSSDKKHLGPAAVRPVLTLVR